MELGAVAGNWLTAIKPAYVEYDENEGCVGQLGIFPAPCAGELHGNREAGGKHAAEQNDVEAEDAVQ
jgi:hypothetical protein